MCWPVPIATREAAHTQLYQSSLDSSGKTARSPFAQQQQQQQQEDFPETMNSSAIMDQYRYNQALLQSMVSDPQQRLAKLMPPRTLTTSVKLDLSASCYCFSITCLGVTQADLYKSIVPRSSFPLLVSASQGGSIGYDASLSGDVRRRARACHGFARPLSLATTAPLNRR